jgi:putative peptidoglycan lipid II flippase
MAEIEGESAVVVGAGAGTGRRIARATGAIAAIKLVWLLVAYVTRQQLNARFGLGEDVKAYEYAFLLSATIFFMINDLLPHSVIPVVTRQLREKGERAGWRLISTLANLQALALVVIVGGAFVSAPFLLAIPAAKAQWVHYHHLTWPVAWRLILGRGSPDLVSPYFSLMVASARVMLLGTVFWSLSSLTYLTLNVYKRFAAPEFGELASKAVLLAVALLLTPSLGIMGFAVGVAAGGATRLVVHLIALGDRLRHYRPIIEWRSSALAQVGLLMLPLVVGVVASQWLRPWADGYFTGQLPGGLAALKTARRVTDPLINIFPVALGIAIFPFVAEYAVRDDRVAIGRALGAGLRAVAFIFVPLTIGLLIMSEPAIRLLFQYGKFTAENTRWVAATMQMYALGLLAQAAEQVIIQIYYGMSDTRTPVAIGLAALGLQLGLVWAGLAAFSGAVGADPAMGFRIVAGGYAAARTLKVAALLVLLPALHKGIVTGRIAPAVSYLVRLGVAVAAMGVAVSLLLQRSLAAFYHAAAPSAMGRLLVLGIPAAGGVGVFVAAAALLRIEEVARVWSVVRHAGRRARGDGAGSGERG